MNVGRRPPVDLYTQLVRWRRRFGLSMAVCALLAANVALWKWGAPAFVADVVQGWTGSGSVPIESGASLSIAGPSFASRDRAAAFAAIIEADGVPAFVRHLPDTRRFEVLAGPYVSSAEAESAQRALAAHGLGDTRLFVDDSLRRGRQTSARPRWSGRRSGQPNVLVAAAPGLLSVVFEMPAPPKEVVAQRTAAAALDVDVEPALAFDEQEWSGPGDALLLRAVALQASASAPQRARFHLAIPPGAQSRVRLGGRRVYIDLAWPETPWPPSGTGSGTGSGTRSGTDLALRAAIDRFRQVQPFLLSAVESPDSQVLGALQRTLNELAGTLRAGRSGEEPARMREAIEIARSATEPDFAGDRVTQAHRAVALFDAVAGEDGAAAPLLNP
jgi:hypothetical protein